MLSDEQKQFLIDNGFDFEKYKTIKEVHKQFGPENGSHIFVDYNGRYVFDRNVFITGRDEALEMQEKIINSGLFTKKYR